MFARRKLVARVSGLFARRVVRTTPAFKTLYRATFRCSDAALCAAIVVVHCNHRSHKKYTGSVARKRALKIGAPETMRAPLRRCS
jgi:hypothetical protein